MKIAANQPRSLPRPRTKNAVLDTIREGILNNELAPAQRLVESELCGLLGASRAAVHHALTTLAHEGLVEIIENRGARVRVVRLQEALHIAEARMVLESLCVARAAERITDEQIADLRGLALQLREIAGNGDNAAFAALTNKVLHTYVAIADQPVVAGMLESLRARNARHRFLLTYRPGRPLVAVPYWLERIDAICNRDAPRSQETVRRHFENVREAMIALDNDDSGRSFPLWR